VAETRLEHVRYDISHRFGGTDTESFINMNPNQTVPVLRDVEEFAI
jgi:glutathione S-transferase